MKTKPLSRWARLRPFSPRFLAACGGGGAGGTRGAGRSGPVDRRRRARGLHVDLSRRASRVAGTAGAPHHRESSSRAADTSVSPRRAAVDANFRSTAARAASALADIRIVGRTRRSVWRWSTRTGVVGAQADARSGPLPRPPSMQPTRRSTARSACGLVGPQN